MFRSTRVRRPAVALSDIPPSPLGSGCEMRRQMSTATAGATPFVKVRTPEEQLASRSVLLSRNRALSGKLPERIPMNTQVLGRPPRIEPLRYWLARSRVEPCDDRSGNTVCDFRDQCVESAQVAQRPAAASRRAVTSPLSSTAPPAESRRHSAATCTVVRVRPGRTVAYADIVVTSSVGLGRASGCSSTAGAAFQITDVVYPSGRTDPITDVVLSA